MAPSRNARMGAGRAKITLPDGVRKSVYGRTRPEAKRKAAELEQRAQAGLDVLTRDQTLAQYLERWLEDVAKPAIRPTTYDSYERVIRVRILPTLGRTKLTAVTPQQLQALYNQLLASGLSPTSVVRTHAILHTAFAQALRWNMIPRNPCDAVRRPRIVRQEMRVPKELAKTRPMSVQAGPALSRASSCAARCARRAAMPLEEARITRLFKRDLATAGVTPVRMHDLRHTAATLLIEQGVPMKAVQSALGHSTISVTMDFYAHVTPAMQDSVAEAIDRLFGTD